MSKKVGIILTGTMLYAILSASLLAGCDSGNSQSLSPAGQTQQESAQPVQQSDQSGQQLQQGVQGQQGQPPSGRGQEAMKQLIAKAAVILGVSESDLSTAFEDAMKEMGGGRVGPGGPGGSGEPPSGEKPSGEPPSGQQPPQGGGQPPSGASDMMKDVYASIAASLGLTTEKVQAAFEQARAELQK